MALFLNLLLGHLLGDYVLQPGRLVIAKRDGIPGLILHTLIVGACSLAVVAGTLSFEWPAAVLVAGMHLVIERLTIVTYLKTRTRGLFTLLFDQTLHVLSIALVVWLVGAWRPSATAVTFGMAVSIRTLAGIVGVMTVSLFGSILVFEAVNAYLGGEDAKGSVLRLDAMRVAGFVERGASLVAAMLIHPTALLLPFVPRVTIALARRRGSDRRRLLLEALAGAVLTATVFVAVEVIGRTAGGTQPENLVEALSGVAICLGMPGT